MNLSFLLASVFCIINHCPLCYPFNHELTPSVPLSAIVLYLNSPPRSPSLLSQRGGCHSDNVFVIMGQAREIV